MGKYVAKSPQSHFESDGLLKLFLPNLRKLVDLNHGLCHKKRRLKIDYPQCLILIIRRDLFGVSAWECEDKKLDKKIDYLVGNDDE